MTNDNVAKKGKMGYWQPATHAVEEVEEGEVV